MDLNRLPQYPAEGSGGDWPPVRFDVYAWVAGEVPERFFRTWRGSDVLDCLIPKPVPMSLTVSLLDDQVCWGEVRVFTNSEGRAWMRLLEHCDWVPRDPKRATETGETGGFFDDGEAFTVPTSELITREQLVRALGHWLDCGKRHPDFKWD